MSDKGVSGKPFMLNYCLNRYKSQEMCDKAVDAFLTTSKFVPNWPFTKKMLENPDYVVFSNDEIDLDDTDSDFVTFYSDGMGLADIDLSNINLNDDNFDEDDPINIFVVRTIEKR